MATPTPLPGDVLLVFMPLRPDPAWIASMESRFPGLVVRWEPHLDAAGKLRAPADLPADVWKGVTLLCSSWAPPMALMEDVRFVQVPSAGVDKWAQHPAWQTEVPFCTGNGTHATQIAEWVVGVWLMWNHHFLAYAALQPSGTAFGLDAAAKAALEVHESRGGRVGILGYGALGREVARLATALGLEVFAHTRTPRTTAAARRDESFRVPGTGDPDGVLPAKWFSGGDTASINAFLAQDLDLLIVATPLTPATRGLLGPEQFAVLQRQRPGGTYVVNIARGAVIDTAALITALETGQIAGAALDVTDPEPLPADHALWRAPNVFITPHVSWQSQHRWRRGLAMLELNLARLAGRGPLVNEVNKAEAY